MVLEDWACNMADSYEARARLIWKSAGNVCRNIAEELQKENNDPKTIFHSKEIKSVFVSGNLGSTDKYFHAQVVQKGPEKRY